ncbi:hypothetical protein L3X38_042586 [Prunus dulcis]|uniref:Zinc finger BED domain-containing protein RICESLEEPER 2-like n=1 Tax=Prunus dulcis TaxID=3755 RepID=A0AAD4UX57_PRUDU|nr:hypothetical protein L3X38_042586 [Prunus dulcis]
MKKRRPDDAPRHEAEAPRQCEAEAMSMALKMANMETSPTPTTDDTPQVVGDGAATLPSHPPTSGKIKPTRKASEVNYMALIAHFIDDRWKLHNRIINFCQITNHRGDAIGRLVEDCLHDWVIDKVFTITLDNVVAYDEAIRHMKRQLKLWGTLLLDGDSLHMRSSPSRLDKVRHCLALQKIGSKGWKRRRQTMHLTFIKVVVIVMMVFRKRRKERLKKGKSLLQKKLKPPTVADWEYARAFVKFLERFYEETIKFSAYETITSNIPFNEMLSIVDELNSMIRSDDIFLKKVTTSMKKKFDKYWGSNIREVNQVLIVAVVLDPRYKMDYVQYSFDELESDDSKVSAIVEGVKDLLMWMYEAYKKEEPAAAQSNVEANVKSGGEVRVECNDLRVKKFVRTRKDRVVVQIKNEVDKFLLEAAQDPEITYFDLLDWWRENSPTFPVLSKIAMDVFAVPISSVPLEIDWLSQVAFDFNKQPSEDEHEFYQALEKMESSIAVIYIFFSVLTLYI